MDDLLQDGVKYIHALLIEHSKTLAIAESCTGGALSALCTARPNASQYLKGSVVVYSNDAKEQLLQVPSSLITHYGAVSRQVAVAMACRVRELLDTDYGLAVTGVAGPGGGSVDKPVGLVWMALAQRHRSSTQSCMMLLNGSRQEIIAKSCFFILNKLRYTMRPYA
jgi:PncC family amidohydrolase